MNAWAAKRFWTDTRAEADADGYIIRLDDRLLRTPAKAPLVVPTMALAQAIADEWAAQQGEIKPAQMPFTRSANAAIDKVMRQQAEVADMLADYGDSDLLCYRADAPAELAARQAARWDPLLDWAADHLSARLVPVAGVMHRPQDGAALARLRAQVHALDPFALTAFHDLVSLSGSLVIGFSAIHAQNSPTALWDLSRLDEDWQKEQWGSDDEAEELAHQKQAAFLHADAFYHMSRG
ncbi:MAG: ATP12 family protein [Paracoccaceae bacterium]